MDEEKINKINLGSDSGVVIAAMACALAHIFDNKEPFLNNLVNWAIYSFIYLLIIIGCMVVMSGLDETKKSKFWLHLIVAVLVCVGLCWVWQAPIEKDVTGYCHECDREIELTYDKEYNSIGGNTIYCDDCYDSYIAYENKLDWLLSAAVFVTETGDRYHKETCQYIQNADSYYIYNNENAEYQGYTPCKVCFADDYDWREHINY